MKKLLLILALTAQAHAVIAFATCSTVTLWSSGTSVTITYSPTNSNAIVIGYDDRNGTGHTTITTVTDNGSTSYTVPASGASSANAPRTSIAYGTVAGSPTSITVNLSGTPTGAAGVVACTWSGSVAFGNINATGSAVSDTNPKIALTMQDANNFNVCILGSTAGTRAWTNNQGTLRSIATGGSGGPLEIADNTQAGTGSLTCGATTSVAASWQASSIELRSTTGTTCGHTLTLLGAGCAGVHPPKKDKRKNA